MYKEAQFGEGFFRSMVEKFSPEAFVQKPFETIFTAVGWMILWKYSRILGLLGLVLETLGVGPSLFGKFLDRAIGAGANKKLDLSETNLQNAATKMSGNISELLEREETGSAADDVLGDIMDIKGCVDVEDAITALYVSRFVKTAKPSSWWRREPAFSIRPSGRVGFFKDFLRRVVGGQSLGFANIIYGFIKMFALGVLGVSAASGLKSLITGKPSKEYKPPISEGTVGGESFLGKPMGTYYANDARDVETTILAWLDKVEGFEKVFRAMRPTDKSIQQSGGFQKLLKRIEQMNNASIYEIDKWKAFVGPSPQEMVKMVLPGAIYEPIGTAPSKKMPVPQTKAPVKPKEELTKLLSEVS